MSAVTRRIRRLEDQFEPAIQPDFLRNPRQRLRIVVSGMDHGLRLETSTCRRTLTASGSLTEVVRLDGIRGSLTDDELEKFVQSFPIERIWMLKTKNNPGGLPISVFDQIRAGVVADRAQFFKDLSLLLRL
jgi:hypothetical protein